MLPVFCRKATWVPSGAAGLLKALPLAASPEKPVNVHGVPVGLYQYNGLVAGGAVNGAAGASKPESWTLLLAVRGLLPTRTPRWNGSARLTRYSDTFAWPRNPSSMLPVSVTGKVPVGLVVGSGGAYPPW